MRLKGHPWRKQWESKRITVPNVVISLISQISIHKDQRFIFNTFSWTALTVWRVKQQNIPPPMGWTEVPSRQSLGSTIARPQWCQMRFPHSSVCFTFYRMKVLLFVATVSVFLRCQSHGQPVEFMNLSNWSQCSSMCWCATDNHSRIYGRCSVKKLNEALNFNLSRDLYSLWV